jgi:hypothetical protein
VSGFAAPPARSDNEKFRPGINRISCAGGKQQLRVRFNLRTNVTYKCKSMLDLHVGSAVLLHLSANKWYFGALVPYVTYSM